MTELEPNSFPRREFLRGALGVAGAVALGLETSYAQAEAPQATSMLSVAYWNGTRLIDARYLVSGDAALNRAGARLRVTGHAGGEALRAIHAHYPVAMNGAETHAPYHAWTRNAQGNVGTRFTLPVTPNAGVLLSALHDDHETFVRLRTDKTVGQPKLKTGLYVLALGQTDWNGCHLDLDAPGGPLSRRTLSGFVPVKFGYRLISVEPA